MAKRKASERVKISVWQEDLQRLEEFMARQGIKTSADGWRQALVMAHRHTVLYDRQKLAANP